MCYISCENGLELTFPSQLARSTYVHRTMLLCWCIVHSMFQYLGTIYRQTSGNSNTGPRRTTPNFLQKSHLILQTMRAAGRM